jgi:hypothetical protein
LCDSLAQAHALSMLSMIKSRSHCSALGPRRSPAPRPWITSLACLLPASRTARTYMLRSSNTVCPHSLPLPARRPSRLWHGVHKKLLLPHTDRPYVWHTSVCCCTTEATPPPGSSSPPRPSCHPLAGCPERGPLLQAHQVFNQGVELLEDLWEQGPRLGLRAEQLRDELLQLRRTPACQAAGDEFVR